VQRFGHDLLERKTDFCGQVGDRNGYGLGLGVEETGTLIGVTFRLIGLGFRRRGKQPRLIAEDQLV